MIRETELNLFVPSPELLVRLASGERPLGVRAGPPRIRNLRETYFDTPDQALRRRGMTCKLRQEEGGEPDVVVTVGEDPDSEGVTSRSRLTASAVGFGVFETLRGDSEPAIQIQKFVDPGKLRPQIALDIQRLGRAYRRGILRRPALLLYFDRITVQRGGVSAAFHELRIRRRHKGGPSIKDLGLHLRDCYHLFPDGLSTLQRAYRILAMEGKAEGSDLSPYALSLAWAAFWKGHLALRRRGSHLCIPTFRESGEDAARALSTDVLGKSDIPLVRLGTTEARGGGAVVEVWVAPDPGLTDEELSTRAHLEWLPWHELLEEVGREDLRDPVLVSSLLLLTRRRLMGQLPWIPPHSCGGPPPPPAQAAPRCPDLEPVETLIPLLREVENRDNALEHRLRSASDFSGRLSRIFKEDVTVAKERVLSTDLHDAHGKDIQLLDFVSIRVRGMLDRLGHCVNEDLLPALEAAHVHVRTWAGLMNADRRSILEHFQARYLPDMVVAPEWGPTFMPDMPPAGCAVGLMARTTREEATRFFHLVLGPDTPSFLPVPGTTTVLPLEEVVRGYFFRREPELEQAETLLFRFTTGEVTVLEPAPPQEPLEPSAEALGGEGAGEDVTPEPDAPEPHETLPEPQETAPEPRETLPEPQADALSEPTGVERRRSIVVRVLVQRTMPESYQAQLLRALERQVSRRDPLIGWSDLYAIHGPLDLSGLDELLRLRTR
jgi:hypothetical protein